ncbi:bifunctional 3'-5' exonuclease/DNA polymerase [Streptomyces sp. BI20]|uniref:bifunctional 3'-5' exonuclease/DNA polymerase n=1 Tax=Streptomyces sp. BI20 TaxID=3403460 RepID=UPI003C74C013
MREPSGNDRPAPDPRFLLAETESGSWRAGAVTPGAPSVTAADPAAAVRAALADLGAGPHTRWVWRSTPAVLPRLLAAGVRIDRCHDIEAVEPLLLAHAGRYGEPRSAAAAWARLHDAPVPADPPARAAEPGGGDQSALFEPGPAPLPPDALLAVHADQLARARATTHPDRTALLHAAESAGFLVAGEMRRAGLPWRADVHRALLTELLGERYGGTGEPRRLAELAAEISAAFGRRVRPDLPAEVIRAFAGAGHRLGSTRRWELEEIDHPAVAPLLEYKRLYRIWTAHGWSWLADWVRDGRFRPEYVPGGTVSGRWTTHGGGALQIPKVIRRAVIADPGRVLVVADADQLEPRVLAAISGDRALGALASTGTDLYAEIARDVFAGDREQAKLAVLGAIYGQTSGDGLRNLAALRRRFPRAVDHVDEAARAGEEGRLVRTHLGRTCPPASHGTGEPDPTGPDPTPADPEGPERGAGAGSRARARGRFTRNYVVQGSAADWALLLLAALRRSLLPLDADLVFFQHDEVIVDCPAEAAPAVTRAITEAAATATALTFGPTPVVFSFTTATVSCYADAK